MAKRRDEEVDPAKSVLDEFYPKGRKRGIVVGIQVDYSFTGRLLKYSLALVDIRSTSVDDGRILGYDNAHGYHHRHYRGAAQPMEFESYESIENRFETEVRKYLETGEC